eukprot:9503534-Lingulodinium_polyedra.AAC.1
MGGQQCSSRCPSACPGCSSPGGGCARPGHATGQPPSTGTTSSSCTWGPGDRKQQRSRGCGANAPCGP